MNRAWNTAMDAAGGRDPTETDLDIIATVKNAYAQVLQELDRLPLTDEAVCARQRLTESCMWATRAILEGDDF